MLGAYARVPVRAVAGRGGGKFWLAALGRGAGIAALGGLVERLLFRHLYGKEELYQLLFTYALVLILSDGPR
jgi:branched-subunit amino acid ABC-type transport system permease component